MADEPQTDTESEESRIKQLDAEEVGFKAHAVAEMLARADELPVTVAATIANEFGDVEVSAQNGELVDRDVVFSEAGVMVEEKAVGVCGREIAERWSPVIVDLDHDGRVLAVNPYQISENTVL